MKKTILGLTVLAGVALASSVHAQGTIWLNNYDSGFGIYEGALDTSARAGTEIEVLAGSTSGNLTPVVATAGNFPGASIFTVDTPITAGGSFFDANFGVVPGVGASGTAFIQVLTWSGAATYALAQTTSGAWYGSSTIFSQTIGSTVPAAPSTPTPASLALPANIIETTAAVPEPSSLALAGLGGFGMLMAMRRKKA
jgi:hypothetical protein